MAKVKGSPPAEAAARLCCCLLFLSKAGLSAGPASSLPPSAICARLTRNPPRISYFGASDIAKSEAEMVQ